MFFTLGAITTAIVSTLTSAGTAAAATVGTAAAATAGTFSAGTAATLATAKGIGLAMAAKGAGAMAAKGAGAMAAKGAGATAIKGLGSTIVKTASTFPLGTVMEKMPEKAGSNLAKHLAKCAGMGSAKGAYEAFRDYDDPAHKQKKTRLPAIGFLCDPLGTIVETGTEASVRKLLQI